MHFWVSWPCCSEHGIFAHVSYDLWVVSVIMCFSAWTSSSSVRALIWAKIQQEGRICELSFWRKPRCFPGHEVLELGRCSICALVLLGSWLCSRCWSWQMGAARVLGMQKVFGAAVAPPSVSPLEAPTLLRWEQVEWEAFATFLVLPLLPSVSMREVATSSSEAPEVGWHRESHQQDFSSEMFGCSFQHSGLDGRADPGVKFKYIRFTKNTKTCHYLHIILNLLMTKLFK